MWVKSKEGFVGSVVSLRGTISGSFWILGRLLYLTGCTYINEEEVALSIATTDDYYSERMMHIYNMQVLKNKVARDCARKNGVSPVEMFKRGKSLLAGEKN